MAAIQYKNKDGKRIPGTTTIISRFKESCGLIHWAWDLGMQGIDYREARDEAAGSGNICHKMMDADIRGVPGPRKTDEILQETWDKAINAFAQYLDFKTQSNLRPEKTEFSLTCECHQYGGTLDAVQIQGKICLLDWKSSNAVYSDYLIQLAAYQHLWDVNFRSTPIEGGCHLVRFSKTDSDFAHFCWNDLSIAFRQFELFREAYEIDKVLKKRLG